MGGKSQKENTKRKEGRKEEERKEKRKDPEESASVILNTKKARIRSQMESFENLRHIGRHWALGEMYMWPSSHLLK